jgi:TolB-like protein/Tfp pilus assembly protein PilF
MTPPEPPPPPTGDEALHASEPDPTSKRWRAIQRLVDAALDLSTGERPAFLVQACEGDAALYESAARLLDACERAEAGGPLAGRAAELAEPILTELAAYDAARGAERRGAVEATLRAALADRYTITRELGRGGMATVYLARDVRHDRAVAVKVLQRDDVAASGARRFLHEIRIAARLTHPHVLSVHDSGEVRANADGVMVAGQEVGVSLLYYVMPYIVGETLRSRLTRDGALPLGDVLRLVRELADALAYAHGQGVVHRDLKPENVLLSGGHAVVADFGIAKAIAAATSDGIGRTSALTSAGVALGTPAYMAPEQAVGDATTDQRADLYALGIIAYELLTGAHPFGTRSPQALVAAHLSESPPPLEARRSDVPPALSALVMRLLAKAPDARPHNAAEVLRILNGIPASSSSSAAAASRGATGGEAAPHRWRDRTSRHAVAVTIALLVSIGAYALWRVALGPSEALNTAGNAAASAGAGPAIGTLAVLPFENTGGAAEDDYFSDGLTDELAHALGRLSGVQMAGRTSSYTFKGKAAPAQEIGRTLDVAAFVNGTVRRGGDRLRITAQLVSTADGKVMWDSVFESRSDDVFGVQDELTRAMVAALAPTLGVSGWPTLVAGAGGGMDRGTADAEAYDLYLKGRYHFQERGTANVSRAIEFFKMAIARDPRFARAHASLAQAYGVLITYIPDGRDSSSALAEASARHAMALDSTLADARVALALAFDNRLQYAEAEAQYRMAIAIEPSNVLAHHALGMLLRSTGRTDEAIAMGVRATELDPLAKSAGTAAAVEYVDARRFSEAEAISRRVLAIDSTFPLAIWSLGLTQLFGGQPDSAVHTFERGRRLYPRTGGQQGLLVLAYAAAGRWKDAERVRVDLRRPGGDPSGGAQQALAEMVFGDREPAVRLLTTRDGQIHWHDTFAGFGCNPLLDPLWPDERFRKAMRELGVAPCTLARPWPLRPDR